MTAYKLKTKKNEASVEVFLNSISDPQKRNDAVTVDKILRQATGCRPKMWGSSIIGYGEMEYTYSNGKTNTWMEIGFSPRKTSLTLYIMTGFHEYAQTSGFDANKFLQKLGRHSTGKSCLYIKKLSDIDLTVLKTLVTESVKHIRQNQKK